MRFVFDILVGLLMTLSGGAACLLWIGFFVGALATDFAFVATAGFSAAFILGAIYNLLLTRLPASRPDSAPRTVIESPSLPPPLPSQRTACRYPTAMRITPEEAQALLEARSGSTK